MPAAQDPFVVLLGAWLQPRACEGRWAIASGPDERAAAISAEALLGDAEQARERLIVRCGDPEADRLLANLAPGLVALLQHLTDRQQEVGRLLLVDGLRRAEIAERLGISRPTVSVMVDRARLVEIGRMAAGLDGLFQAGVARAAGRGPGAAARIDRPAAESDRTT